MFDPTGESPANIIGGVIGGASGSALGYLLADALGLKRLEEMGFDLCRYSWWCSTWCFPWAICG